MSVLSDKEIKIAAESGMVRPFDKPNLVQPASLDIRLGYTAKRVLTPQDTLFNHNRIAYKDIDFSVYSETRPYFFMPQERLLIASLETFCIPDNICGQIVLRSSAARQFIQHINAGWIDPGWHGSKLTMELINFGHTPFKLYSHLSITQIVFFWLQSNSVNPYNSKYNNNQGVSNAK